MPILLRPLDPFPVMGEIAELIPLKFSPRDRAPELNLAVGDTNNLPVPTARAAFNVYLFSNPERIGSEYYNFMNALQFTVLVRISWLFQINFSPLNKKC
jgi:hypothetical protein